MTKRKMPETAVDAGPLIRDDDPYFGAESPSETTLLDELGFVPSHHQWAGKEARCEEIVQEEKAKATLQIETINKIMDEFEELTRDKDRYPLANLPNLPSSPSHQMDGDEIFTVDEELGHQLEEILYTRAPEGLLEELHPGMPSRVDPLGRPHLSLDLAHISAPARPLAMAFTLLDLPARPPVKWRRSEDDMYTPKEVRGTGFLRMGRCNICGIWLKIKQSAYWYHMNFIHGISASTGRPHPPPIAIRQRAGSESTVVVEGRCGTCQEWIPVHQQGSPLNVVPTDLGCLTSSWWHHAQKCAIARTKQKTAFGGARKERPSHASRV